MGVLKARYDASEAKNEEQKDLIYMAEKEKQDAARVLASTEEMCDAQRKKIEALTNQLADLQKMLTERIGQVEKEAKDSKENLERELTETKTSLETELTSVKEELETKTSLLTTTTAALKNQQSQLEVAHETELKLKTEVDGHKERNSALEGQVHDLKMEGDIVSKKANRMVVELKAQLKKDALRVRELEVALAEARDDMQELHGALGRKTGLRNGGSGSDSDTSFAPPSPSHSSTGSTPSTPPPAAFARSHTLSTIHQRHLSGSNSSPQASPTGSGISSPARPLPPSSLSCTHYSSLFYCVLPLTKSCSIVG
jgi:myosin heavy subunit